MKRNSQVAILFLLTLLIGQGNLQISSSTDKVEKYCDTNYLSNLDLTTEELEDMRPDRDNAYYDNYVDIINYYNDDDEGDLIDSFKTTFILMIILIGLTLLTLIGLICICCCCEQEGNVNKFWVVIAWILFICFVALFVIVLVFLGRSQNDTEDVICNIFLIPSGVIDGLSDEGNEYIGLANLRDSYTNFRSEMDNLPTANV